MYACRNNFLKYSGPNYKIKILKWMVLKNSTNSKMDFFLSFSIYMYMCIHNVGDCWVLVFILIDLNALQMNCDHDINCVNFV